MALAELRQGRRDRARHCAHEKVDLVALD
jgi:hypothetical protein